MSEQDTSSFFLKVGEWISKVPDFVTRNRWKMLSLFVGITVFLAAGMPRLTMDESMDSWFRKDDNTLQDYHFFRYVFGSDETVLVMYQTKDGDVFSKESLETVSKLEEILNNRRVDPKSNLTRIARVRSIVSADYLENRGDTLVNRKFIGKNFPKSKAEVEALRTAALAHRNYPGMFISRDSKFGTLIIQTDYGSRLAETEKATESDTDEFDFEGGEEDVILTREHIPKLETPQMDGYAAFIGELNEVFKQQDWILKKDPKDPNQINHGESSAAILMTGNPYVMNFFSTVIIKEMGMYTGLCIMLIMITLWIALRSFSAVIWPTLIIMLSIVWLIGFIGWTGIVMSMMINIVVFLLLAAGIASSIHIMSGYKLHLAAGHTPSDAIRLTYKNSGLPIFLAALTTMGGMISLLAVPIVPVQNFSIFAAVGVWMAFLGTTFLLPLLMSFWAPKVGKEQESPRLQKFLTKCGDIGMNRPKLMYAIFAAITLVTAMGIPKIVVDSNLTKMIKRGNGFTEAYEVVDKHFGGTASVEVVINTGEADGIKDPALLQAIDRFGKRVLKDAPEFIARIDSIAKIAKDSYRTMTDGSDANYRIPNHKRILTQALITFDSADPESRKQFVDDNWQTGRISLLAFTKGAYEYSTFMKDLEIWADEEFAQAKAKNPKLQVTFTGGMPLMMQMTAFISKSQITSFGIALLVICALLLLMYRSLKFGLMALIPNVFPIIVISGLLGWSGIPLDSDTLLVIPIAIGIAVDDTIHFLTHYRTAVLRGMSLTEAIETTLKEVGQAMVFTSFVLSVGFLVFILSAYQPLTNFGVLSSIAIIMALFADLLLLPALLIVIRPFEKKEKTV